MKLLASRCRAGEPIPALAADAAHVLLTYSWPGNVRELDNVMQRALILANGPVIEREHIHLEPVNAAQPSAGGESISVRPPRSPVRPPRSLVLSKETAPAEKGDAAGVLESSLSAAEHELILQALRADSGNRQAVAKRLGISPRTLRYKLARMREAGVEV